jgi:hypothetical protein
MKRYNPCNFIRLTMFFSKKITDTINILHRISIYSNVMPGKKVFAFCSKIKGEILFTGRFKSHYSFTFCMFKP